MTPYNLGTTAAINPVLVNSLTFGKVDQSLKEEIGEIIERGHSRKFRTMTYKVKFPGQTDEEAIWLTEEELCTVYSK